MILHSFLENGITIERFRFKFCSLRDQHVRSTTKTIEKLKKSVDLSLTSEELDLQIKWEPEFQILSEKNRLLI
jgi:hypothetical protein